MLSYGHGGAQGAPSDRPHYFAFFSEQSVFKGKELFHFREEADQSNRFILLVSLAQSFLLDHDRFFKNSSTVII